MFVYARRSQHQGVGKELLERFEERARERHFSLFTVNFLEWAECSGIFYKKHGYKEYVQKDEEACHDLIFQVVFMKKIGRLNNGCKHLMWKTITER